MERMIIPSVPEDTPSMYTYDDIISGRLKLPKPQGYLPSLTVPKACYPDPGVPPGYLVNWMPGVFVYKDQLQGSDSDDSDEEDGDT